MLSRLTHIGRPGPRRLYRTPQRGFALLITITLLAFLVLLLVSLASLTRVETQVAGNNQQLAQARQNALMALNIALGQLQKYAGPDQRVTATADLVAGGGGARLTNNLTPNSLLTNSLAPSSTSTVADKQVKPKGLGRVQAGTRFWTGVWGNFDAPSDIYQATPRPVLLNWLVSGNENRTFAADVAGASPTGKITASDGTGAPSLPILTTKETDSNAPISATTTTATTALTIGANTPAVLLVGPNTAGTAARRLDPPTNTITENAIDRYVVAPLVDIKASPGSVPGLAAADTPVIGRYAYWVGDEGVKARYNLKDPYSANTDPYTDPTAHYRIATALRSGLETMDGFAGYPVNSATLNKVIAALQVRVADTALTIPDAQKHFHDYTTTARGVLADTQNGGLRKDLTYLLSAPAFSLSGQPIIPAAYSPMDSSGAYRPTWDWLKSFRELPKNAGNLDYNKSGTAASVAVQPATATQMGVGPVITFARMFIEANIIGDHVELHTRLAVVLGNPYPVSLTGSGLKMKFAADDYYYDWAIIDDKQDSVCGIALYKGVAPETKDNAKGQSLAFDGQTVVPKLPLYPAAVHNASVTGITQSTKSLLGQINFTIPSINLPPGKQKIYSISSNQTGSIDSATDIALSEGDAPNVAYMTTVVPSGDGGWPAISTVDDSTNRYTIRLTDNGNFSISLLDASDAVIAKHQHIDIIGNAKAAGTQDWTARDEAALSYKPLGGVDFYPIWPGQATDAISNKGVQLFSDYNLRAANHVMPKSSMPRGGTGTYGKGFDTRPPYYVAPRRVGDATLSQFAVGLTPTPPWGYSWISGTVQEVALFDVPRRDPANDGGTLLSLGFLQHANLTADDENINVGHQPGAAFGNSRFNPFVRQREVITGGALDGTNNNVYDAFVLQGTPAAHIATPAPSTKTRFFDMSYLLNSALWDSYYFSTLPQNAASTASFTPGATDLPNSRLAFTAGYMPATADLGLNGGTGTDHSTSSPRTLPGESTPARYQMIEGAFNINSTSIQAWKSLLASLRTTYLNNSASSPTWTTASPGLNAPFPRAVYPWANKSSLPDESSDPAVTNKETAGQLAEDYAGFRDLTDAQLETLAENIVRQVRMRGPFLSLAHFINRSLHDTDTACLSGPLQAAIDANTVALNRPADTTSTFRGVQTTPGFVAYPTTPTQLTPVVPNRLTGLPGWLSQADILQAVGPVLSARSDTFCIRVYGEVRDPLNSSTTAAPLARAWCEATVQRCPDYVDSTDRPSDTLGTLTLNNRNLGRRFRVISFRWLTPNDI